MDGDAILGTCFRVGAVLKCDRQSMVKRLAKLKSLERIADSSKLKYTIMKTGRKDDASILELSDDCICLLFFCRKPSNAGYNSNLVIFLSLMLTLEEFYAVEFGDLYRYVIEAINNRWQNTIKDDPSVIESLKERIGVLNDSNCRLSHQLVRLSNINSSIMAELPVYKQFSKRIIDASRESEGHRKNELKSYILAETGMDPEELRRVELYLNQ